jgi:DNA-binding transcriptional LysR family regulator
MQDLDLKSLRLFVTVCDHANIKLAAEQEHIEPSAISKRIAQLENELGAQLLVRGRRGVEPTPTGVALLEHARSMLFSAERIRSDVASFNRGIKGHVRLVATSSAVAEALPDDLAEFMRQEDNQNIQVDIEERFSRELVRFVTEGGASLGVCWDNVDFGKLEHRPYRVDELALAVPMRHPLAGCEAVSFAQTLQYPHVGLPPATAVHSMLQRAAGRAGLVINYRAIVTNFDAELRVVAAGLGVSVTPKQVALRSTKVREISVVRLTDSWAKRRFAVCFRDPATLLPAALRMLEFLASKAAGEQDAVPRRHGTKRPANGMRRDVTRST